jgi:uncharacterized protein YndB with AHSA1/START domain
MNEKLTFKREYASPIESVWAALTSGEALSDWLMAGNFSPEPGSEFNFSEPGLSVRGTVLEVVRNKILSYSWISRRDDDEGPAGVPSVVTWTLSPTPSKGTLVTLEHVWAMEAKPVVMIEAAVNWSYAIHSALASHLARVGRPPVPIVYLSEPMNEPPFVLERAGFRQPEETAACC